MATDCQQQPDGHMACQPPPPDGIAPALDRMLASATAAHHQGVLGNPAHLDVAGRQIALRWRDD